MSMEKASNASSNYFFFSKNSPKSKYITVTIIQNISKQQILTFKELEAENVWYFCLENYLNHYSFTEIVINTFSDKLLD